MGVRLPSFPQRGQLDQLQILELPDDAPPDISEWLAKARFTQQMIRWFSLLKPVIEDAADSEPNVVLSPATAGMRGEDAQAMFPAKTSHGQDVDEAYIFQRLLPIIVDAVVADIMAALPPAQRNWVDYYMRQAGGIVKLEGETASFPGLRRSTNTATDTESVLADGSALTGHEVLDEVYGAGWSAKIEVPTKNAVYTKINALEPRIPSVLPVPVNQGGTAATTAGAARTNLGAAASGPGPGAGTYTVGFKLTGGGTNGTITINADGVITAIQQAT